MNLLVGLAIIFGVNVGEFVCSNHKFLIYYANHCLFALRKVLNTERALQCQLLPVRHMRLHRMGPQLLLLLLLQHLLRHVGKGQGTSVAVGSCTA